MSAIPPNDLLRHHRELSSSILLRQERIRLLVLYDEPANSTRLRVLRIGLAQDQRAYRRMHRQLARAWRQSRVLSLWMRNATRVS
jgi:hypothetical protein